MLFTLPSAMEEAVPPSMLDSTRNILLNLHIKKAKDSRQTNCSDFLLCIYTWSGVTSLSDLYVYMHAHTKVEVGIVPLTYRALQGYTQWSGFRPADNPYVSCRP